MRHARLVIVVLLAMAALTGASFVTSLVPSRADDTPRASPTPDPNAPVSPPVTGTVPADRFDSLESIIDADTRTQVTNTSAEPWKKIVNLDIDFDGDLFPEAGCTGSMIGPKLVLTAGHCVYDPETLDWASYVWVTPGQNGLTMPYGWQRVGAASLRSSNGWVLSGNPNFDWGAIVLPDKTLYNQTGAFALGVADDLYLTGAGVNIAGYPGDKTYGTMWAASGPVTAFTSTMISHEVDTIAGQSGAPVWASEGSNRYIVGVHAYGVKNPYCNPGDNCGTRMTLGLASTLESLGANPTLISAVAHPLPPLRPAQAPHQPPPATFTR